MGLFTQNKKTFGLDVSDRVIRAVELKGQGKSLAFEAYSWLELPEGVIRSGEILEPAAFSEAVKECLNRPRTGRFTTKRVIACLPERKSFIKILDLSKSDETAIEEKIGWEIVQHVPYNQEEIYLDWETLQTDDPETTRVITNTTPRTIADTYVSALEEADLQPVNLVIESLAIARSLFTDEQEKEANALIIDLGRQRTSFFIFDRGAVRFSASAQNISGSLMTKLIAEKLRLTEEQAEQAKRLCGLDPSRGKAAIPKLLMPVIDRLIQRSFRIINFYKNSVPDGRNVEKVVLVGGGANLRNIAKEMTQIMNYPVEIGDIWSRFPQNKKKKLISKGEQLSQATVLGLGMLGLNSTFSSRQ
ncbi:MAG: type IV pilus assembly protein PilM [bacterium]|nr:type IV pilus assembly protein PilM [bacterium]